MLHVRVFERLALRDPEHLGALLGIQELASLIEQLQRVPLLRVMASGQDNTATSALHSHGQLRCRSRRQVNVDHVESHSGQRT